MGKQIAELLMDLFGMHLILPFIGHVMRITDHFSIRSSGSITDAKRSTTANERNKVISSFGNCPIYIPEVG